MFVCKPALLDNSCIETKFGLSSSHNMFFHCVFSDKTEDADLKHHEGGILAVVTNIQTRLKLGKEINKCKIGIVSHSVKFKT